MLLRVLIVSGLLGLLTACGSGPKDGTDPNDTNQGQAAPANQSMPALLIAQQDLLEISLDQIASGPVISGSLQAQKQADLLAEVSAIVMQVLKDDGDKVEKGDLLVRLDDTAFRQALNSAKEAERVAQQGFDQAQRQLSRLKTLSSTGAVSIQAEEDA